MGAVHVDWASRCDAALRVVRAFAVAGAACPSNREIANGAGLSQTTMSLVIKQLAAKGDLKVEYKPRNRAVRRFIFDDGEATKWTVLPPGQHTATAMRADQLLQVINARNPGINARYENGVIVSDSQGGFPIE